MATINFRRGDPKRSHLDERIASLNQDRPHPEVFPAQGTPEQMARVEAAMRKAVRGGWQPDGVPVAEVEIMPNGAWFFEANGGGVFVEWDRMLLDEEFLRRAAGNKKPRSLPRVNGEKCGNVYDKGRVRSVCIKAKGHDTRPTSPQAVHTDGRYDWFYVPEDRR